MKKVGLRVDVDTLRGTQKGVPALCKVLSDYQIQATFYFSLGPDNMGRHIWRLFRPMFMKKMLCSNAPRLYGWRTLLMGTAWPGPIISKHCKEVIQQAQQAGHEIGLHAWDHHLWQKKRRTPLQLKKDLRQGMEVLTDILGAPPCSSAAPGWRCNNHILQEKEAYVFNSDCRGKEPFFPVVDGTVLKTPQIPVTLPTYDEVIGRDGITHENYNQHILSLIQDDKLNVLTIHAEVEGMALRYLFLDFLNAAKKQNITFVPLGSLLDEFPCNKTCKIIQKEVPGREGWISSEALHPFFPSRKPLATLSGQR